MKRNAFCRSQSFQGKVFTAIVTYFVTIAVSAAATVAAEEFRVDIPVAKAPDALTDYVRQTGRQVLFDPSILEAYYTREVAGTLGDREALELLLSDTGLVFDVVNSRTFAITASRDTSRASEGLRVQLAAGAEVDGGPSGIGVNTNSVRERNASERQDPPTPPLSASVVPEVLITGSHIRGEESAGAQIIVIDRDQIDKSGYATTQDLLSMLPQNGPAPGSDAITGGDSRIIGNYGFGSGVNLRGLGAGATLVLVNGARQAASGTGGSFVDISNIPLSAIERIEVLTDGASAVYGSDAIGGVVNIVLRRSYNGFQTQVRLGTLDGDAGEITISQLAGRSWDRGSLFAGYELHRRDALPASARRFSASSDQRPNGGDDFSETGGNPGNILCPFDRTDCVPFEAAFAIPRGQDGTGLQVSDLISVAPDGSGANRNNLSEGSMLLPEERLDSAFFNMSQKIGSRAELVATGRISTRPVELLTNASSQLLTVTPTNPYFVDAFGDSLPINLAYSLGKDVALRSDGDTTTISGAATLNTTIGSEWQAKIGVSYSRQKLDFHAYSVDSVLLDEALGNYDDPATAELDIDNPATSYNPLVQGFFNPFGDGRNTADAVLSAIQRDVLTEATWSATSGSVIADGPIVQLPGGAVRMALGVDFREESADTMEAGLLASDLRSRVNAAFVEIAFPLVTASNRRTLVHDLRLSLAGRYEDYIDFGSTFDPRIGVNWSPHSSFSIRGTWGTSFKAPSPVDRDTAAFNIGIATVRNLRDPASPMGTSRALVVQGVNPLLHEETASSWTAGLDFHPAFLPKLSAALTYYDTDYTDKIGSGGTPGRQFQILQEENIWPDIVNRNPTSEEVTALCAAAQVVIGDCVAPLPVVIVDLRKRNIAVQITRGVDLLLEYPMQIGLGTLHVSLNGNYTLKNERGLAKTTPRVDILDTLGNPLSLRMRAGLTWEYRNWGVDSVLTYLPSYDDPISGLNATPQTVDSWTTLDVGVRHSFNSDRGLLSGTTVAASILNVLDEDPPFVNAMIGYDFVNADPYGRSMSLRITKSW